MTTEEVSLLVQIYLETGHTLEAVDLLRGLTQHSQGAINKQDPQLLTALLLDTLEASERWKDAFETCKGLLEMPEYRGDDRVWHLLERAGSEPEL
jgi:hypothetical protein